MTAPSVSIVIVNFNTGEYLARCLDTLAAGVAPLEYEVIVVDNASTDDSATVVGDHAPRAQLIRNALNAGFGRAVNQGVARTRAKLVLLVNPDCELHPGAVALLVDELLVHDDCAVAGPDALNPDGSSQGNARGDPNLLTGLFGRATLLTRAFPHLPRVTRNIVVPSHVPKGATSVEVDWISGACLLLRKAAFEAVGGFDERYFLYWEDADLGRRLRRAGYRIRYVPAAKVVHAIGGSSTQAQELAIRAFHRSGWLYYSRWAAPGRLNPMRLLARALLGVRCQLYLWRSQLALRRVRIGRRGPKQT
jgi:N-acetylglucosaminyl-diphospho-decaprenol L-rhamnosyltransferase